MSRVADVVVIGGGFAGFWAAAAARRTGGDRLSIALISPGPNLELRPRLYEADPATLGAPLEPALDLIGVGLLADSATSVRTDGNRAELRSGSSIEFGSLVIAIGSSMPRPPIPGAEGCWSIDTQDDAIAFDRRLAELVDRPGLRIGVVGAGFTGIELALELAGRCRSLGRSAQLAPPEVSLFDRATVVGNELGSGPRPVIEEALAAAEIDLQLGVAISDLTAQSVSLVDHDPLDFDAVVLCTGLRANDLTIGPEEPDRDELGRITVDTTLAMPGSGGAVLVAGDMAAADVGDGHLALQSCQHALQMGRVAGENAARFLSGRPAVEYRQERYVTCLDLGDHGAVFTEGWNRVPKISGADAKQVKRRINQDVILPDLGGGASGLLRQSEIDPSDR